MTFSAGLGSRLPGIQQQTQGFSANRSTDFSLSQYWVKQWCQASNPVGFGTYFLDDKKTRAFAVQSSGLC